MKRLFSAVLALLFFCFLTLFTPLAGAQECDCPSGGIAGTGSVFWETIDCGGGHDCRMQICGAGEGECCKYDGGWSYCTWCDICSCGMITVGCT